MAKYVKPEREKLEKAKENSDEIVVVQINRPIVG